MLQTRHRTESMLKNHEISHRVENPFSCSQCDDKFESSQLLMIHGGIHDDENQNIYKRGRVEKGGKKERKKECVMALTQPFCSVLERRQIKF